MGRFEELDKQHRMPDADEVDRDVRELAHKIPRWQSDRYHSGPRESDDPVEIQRRAIEQEHRSDSAEQLEPDQGDAEAAAQLSDDEDDSEADGPGGGSGSSSGSSGAAGSTVTGPEPAPQRNDPDDGEDPESEPESAESADSADSADEPAAEDSEDHTEQVETAAEDDGDDESDLAEPFAEADETAWQPWQRRTGSDPQSWVRKVGFRYIGAEGAQRIEQAEAAGESAPRLGVRLNDFPEELVTTLRRRIAPVAGGRFAESVSAISLITAFMIVKLGLDPHDCDQNTVAAARAVAQTEPQLDALVETVADQNQRLSGIETALRKTMAQVRDNTELSRSVELGASYWLTERTVGMQTDFSDVTTSLNKNLPKVLSVREEVRKFSEQQQRHERDDENRPIS